MKILHVIPSLSAVHGGPSRAIRLIAQALLAQGVSVEIATTDDDGSGKRIPIAARAPLPRGGMDIVGGLPPGRSRQSDILIRYFPKRTEFYKVSPGFARWVFSRVRDYDVVHIHALFSFTSIAAAWAARWAGVPYVVRPLGTLAQYGVTQRRPWLKQLSLKFIEGPILRHAAAVHFTAEAEKREAEALGIPMRGVVIPLGVEFVGVVGGTSSGRLDLRDDHAPVDRGEGAAPTGDIFFNPLLTLYPQLASKRIVLFLARLDAKKNVEGLLKAFSLLTKENPDLHLLIAGDGESAYTAGLKQLAAEFGLADRIIWAGHLDGELKAAAFAAAHVFALPSYSENFGIAAAEALLAGLPCVLGEGVAIADEVAQAGAGVVTSTDAEDIAHGLREVLSDEAHLAEMGKRAAIFARDHYSLGAMGEKLVRLYGGIVRSRLPEV